MGVAAIQSSFMNFIIFRLKRLGVFAVWKSAICFLWKCKAISSAFPGFLSDGPKKRTMSLKSPKGMPHRDWNTIGAVQYCTVWVFLVFLYLTSSNFVIFQSEILALFFTAKPIRQDDSFHVLSYKNLLIILEVSCIVTRLEV